MTVNQLKTRKVDHSQEQATLYTCFIKGISEAAVSVWNTKKWLVIQIRLIDLTLQASSFCRY